MYISQCLSMAAAILLILSRDQNRKKSNLRDVVQFLHLKTVKVNDIVLKECILSIHLHLSAF